MKRTKLQSNILYALLVLIIGLSSCTKDPEEDVLFNGDEYENIMQYIDANSEFTAFASIVRSAQMTDVLSSYNHHVGGDGYTLFLPSNSAVDDFIAENGSYNSLADLLADTVYSTEIVRYHTVNAQVLSNEFPNGAIPDKTISNYYLTIVYSENGSIITYAVNDESQVLITDIEKSNGVIHTIDKMLTPIVYTSYQWVENNSDYSIFKELLYVTGLQDTLNAFVIDDYGREDYYEYTMFAESNTLYSDNGINSFQELIVAIAPEDNDYLSASNAVNQYARYHILEKSVFLDEFETAVYNTYGDLPVSVDLETSLKFNVGTAVFDTIFSEGDTTLIDYLQVELENSNVVTKTGSVHQLDELLYPYLPGLETVTYQFYEDPIISAYKGTEGNHYILDEELEKISLSGTDYLYYIQGSDIESCSNNDYLQVNGDFDFSYTTPRILAGRYKLKLVMQRGYSSHATIQATVDGKKVGVAVDLTKDSQKFNTFTVGTVELNEFSTHVVKLNTIIPGRMLLDRIIFTPID